MHSAPVKLKTVKTKTAASKTQPGPLTNETKGKKHADKKRKLVRDSFTFPAADYARIGVLKQRSREAGHEVKKSELLRAGLIALSALSDSALLEALGAIDRLKPDRHAQ